MKGADLKVGNLIKVGFNLNYDKRKVPNTFFFLQP